MLTISLLVRVISVLVFSRGQLSVVLKLHRGARIRCLGSSIRQKYVEVNTHQCKYWSIAI